MINLFIARSPLQLFNCIEASRRFHDGKQNVLLMICRQEYDLKLMQSVSRYGVWDDVILWDYKGMFAEAVAVARLLSRIRSIGTCFIGDYTRGVNVILNTVKPEKVVWVDDGVSSLQRAKLLASGDLQKLTKHFQPKSRVAARLEQLLRIDVKYQANTAFFSMYPEIAALLDDFEVVHNDYRFFRQQFSLLPHRECVYFIGSDLRRFFLKDESKFEGYLAAVAKYYAGRTLVYVLHRKENQEYMAQMGQKYGFNIVRFNDIIEVQLLKQGWCPGEIATFCSSALDTVSILCQPKMTAFTVALEDVKDDRVVGLRELYKRYESMTVTIVTNDGSGQTGR